MATEERVLRLGVVRVEGPAFEFTPQPATFLLRKGETGKIGIAYEYFETSTAKERVTITLDVHVEGMGPLRLEHPIHDRPFHQDDEIGVLAMPVRLDAAGTRRGRFTVRVDYSTAKQADRAVHHERTGEFRLTIA